MNTQEVSERTGVCFAACSRWAKNNGVARVPVKGIMAYEWTEEDMQRFLLRRPAGRPRREE